MRIYNVVHSKYFYLRGVKNSTIRTITSLTNKMILHERVGINILCSTTNIRLYHDCGLVTCSATSTVWSETTRAKCWTFQTSWSLVSPGLSSTTPCGAGAVPGSRGPPSLAELFRTATAQPRQRPGPSWPGQSLNRGNWCTTEARPLNNPGNK